MEVQAKKKRSVKWKTQASLEGCPPAQSKALKVGVSSSPLSIVGAGDSSGRAANHTPPPPPPPCPIPDDVGRGRFGTVGDEDSLLSHVELTAGLVSSILRDSDLKKVDALSVEEALTLSLQGAAFVRPSTFTGPFPYCFMLLIDSFLFFGRGLIT